MLDPKEVFSIYNQWLLTSLIEESEDKRHTISIHKSFTLTLSDWHWTRIFTAGKINFTYWDLLFFVRHIHACTIKWPGQEQNLLSFSHEMELTPPYTQNFLNWSINLCPIGCPTEFFRISSFFFHNYIIVQFVTIMLLGKYDVSNIWLCN